MRVPLPTPEGPETTRGRKKSFNGDILKERMKERVEEDKDKSEVSSTEVELY